MPNERVAIDCNEVLMEGEADKTVGGRMVQALAEQQTRQKLGAPPESAKRN